MPSIEVASGSYYETQRDYGSPGSQEQQSFYSSENYESPTSGFASPSANYAHQQNQHQPYLVGTYGPPSAVQFQSNEEHQLGSQSNHAVASVRQLQAPAQYNQHGSFQIPQNYNGAAHVQSVQVPSGSYGSPVVGASLSFAGPQSQFQNGGLGFGGFGGFGGPHGAPIGGHSFTASPSPVYGSPFGYGGGDQRPQFARQYQQPPQHRFGPSPVKAPTAGYSQSFGGSFGKSNGSPFAHQSFRGAGPGSFSHFGGPPSFNHPSRNYGPPSFQYQSHSPQSFPGISSAAYPTGHPPSQVINDGYGSGPAYATGSKGLGHYTAASHSSSSFARPPKASTIYHRASPNSGPPSKNTFKPSAYLGSTDLSATSQTSTYVLPSSDYAEAATSHGHQSYAPDATVDPSSKQSYNTIQYSAV